MYINTIFKKYKKFTNKYHKKLSFCLGFTFIFYGRLLNLIIRDILKLIYKYMINHFRNTENPLHASGVEYTIENNKNNLKVGNFYVKNQSKIYIFHTTYVIVITKQTGMLDEKRMSKVYMIVYKIQGI